MIRKAKRANPAASVSNFFLLRLHNQLAVSPGSERLHVNAVLQTRLG
jgi:hypothetical protein